MRCTAQVCRKDTFRVSRGKGFMMHYNRGQCSRKASIGNRCSQHSKMDWVPDYPYAETEQPE
jgi:hypothetical protein